MGWIRDNKGGIIVTLAVLMLGVLLGLLLHGLHYGAEAVIGGVGNVTDYENPHNLSANSAGIKATGEEQICIFCHTPHHAITDASILNAPLWNHTLSSEHYDVKTQGSYYTNTGPPPSSVTITVNLLTSPPDQPDGASKLCLSCHDGTVALGDVATGTIDIDHVSNACVGADDKLVSGATCRAYIGNDLTRKHVVSVPMNQALLDASAANCPDPSVAHKLQYPWAGSMDDIVLLRPTASTYGGSPGVTSNSGKYKSGYNYGVQCSTCHDPHLWADTAAYSSGWRFLVAPFNSLCSACHISC
jgi:hypothetical protein